MKLRSRTLRFENLEGRAMLTTIFVAPGADGDGSADSPFGSIQDAVEAADDAPGDDTIMIAAGVYEENVDINDDDALTLKGQGDVIIRHDPEIPMEEDDDGTLVPDPDDIIEAEGNVTFQNLTIEGLNLDEDFGGRGIDAEEGTFIFINVDISGTNGDSLRVRDFDGLTIQNSSFSSVDADGMDIEDGGTVLISNTDASHNDDEGLEVDRVDSIVVTGGQFLFNGDDGIDIDSSVEIRVVNVFSQGNAGNGFQVEAEEGDILSVEVIGSRFLDNGENGIQIVEDSEEDSILWVSLKGNTSSGNALAGYELVVSGDVDAKGNKASGNADNTLPGA